MEYEGDRDTSLYNNTYLKLLGRLPKAWKESEETKFQRKNRDHPDHRTAKYDTKMSRGNLRRLTVNQAPVKYHHLELVLKTCKEYWLDTTQWAKRSTGNYARNLNDDTKKWYMHNPTSVLENETHKFPRDFDIQTDLGQTIKPYNNQQ